MGKADSFPALFLGTGLGFALGIGARPPRSVASSPSPASRSSSSVSS